jgi:poly-gamma-glutamate synthesis protein (capsule biosynthesis protein)
MQTAGDAVPGVPRYLSYADFDRWRAEIAAPYGQIAETDDIQPRIRRIIASDDINTDTEKPEPVIYLKKKHRREIVISAVGDLALASNYTKQYAFSFYEFYDLYGPDYFGENIRHVFIEESDFSIANLECALTYSKEIEVRGDNRFRYRGYPEYTSVLTSMGIDAVSLANNHTFDYGQIGYDDTITALREVGVGYFGNGKILIEEINGITVGFIGVLSEHRVWQAIDALAYLDSLGVELKIVSYHWGNNDEMMQNSAQVAAGRLLIDHGADLVLGHHPHVLQGIEKYKGKYIVYSLGDFLFDGSVITNIENRTSIIFQKRFVLYGDEITESEINLIPILITSNFSRNNFKPVIVEGTEQGDAILRKIEARSPD